MAAGQLAPLQRKTAATYGKDSALIGRLSSEGIVTIWRTWTLPIEYDPNVLVMHAWQLMFRKQGPSTPGPHNGRK